MKEKNIAYACFLYESDKNSSLIKGTSYHYTYSDLVATTTMAAQLTTEGVPISCILVVVQQIHNLLP